MQLSLDLATLKVYVYYINDNYISVAGMVKNKHVLGMVSYPLAGQEGV